MADIPPRKWRDIMYLVLPEVRGILGLQRGTNPTPITSGRYLTLAYRHKIPPTI
jgi:hypothetical protein